MKTKKREIAKPLLIESGGKYHIATRVFYFGETLICCINGNYKPLTYKTLENAKIAFYANQYFNVADISHKNAVMFKPSEYTIIEES